MLRSLWLVLGFMLCVNGFTQEENLAVQAAATAGEPSSFVGGMVSAITGDCVIVQDDYVVPGAEPIHLSRVFLCNDGWYFSRELFAEAFFPTRWNGQNRPALLSDKVYKKVFHALITIHESRGTSLVYHNAPFRMHHRDKARKENRMIPIPLAKNSYLAGLTNCSSGEISGRLNLKNNQVFLSYNEDILEVKTAEGGTRIYQVHPLQKDKATEKNYHLTSETRPNGNHIIYEWDGNTPRTLRTIRSTNPSKTVTYAWVRFQHYPRNNGEDVVVETSDGKTLRYSKTQHSKLQLVDQVISPELPNEKLEYLEVDKRVSQLIKRKFPNGREVHISYDPAGPSYNRVQTLSMPVGHDETPLVTHHFNYFPQCTEVVDSEGNKTLYRYSSSLRLDSIEWFSAQGLSHVEKLAWGKEEHEEASFLLAKSFVDGANHPLFSKRLFYDALGNIVQEKFYGNITGKCRVPLTLSANNLPEENGVETYTKWRTYSTDGRNHLLSEKEQNGLCTLYTYLPDTDLPASKLTCEHEAIKLREFFEYDSDRILVRHIIDNGATAENDLSGVTQRTLRVITPRHCEQFYGLPDTIEERYWNGKEEVLTKKTVLTYSKEGKVICQSISDATGTLRYQLHAKYDEKGRIVEETNALGQVAKSSYDENGNKILYEDFSGRVSTKMKYDFCNRLIQSKEIAEDDKVHTTEHRYDPKNNKIATIDYLGNETRYGYDAFGRLTATHFPAVLNADGETVHLSERRGYDSAGNLTSLVDPRGEERITQYNARGKPIRITHPDGAQESFTYTLDEKLESTVDPEGMLTSYTYDIFGRETSKKITGPDGQLLSQETFVYNAFHLLSKTDAEGHTTTYTYDGAGRKIAEEFEGERVTYTYDSLGRLYSTQKGSLIHVTELDLLGRIISEKQTDEQGSLFTKIDYEYDASGNKTCIIRNIDGREAREYFIYDAFGRPVRQIDAANNTTYITYLEERSLKRRHLDPQGLCTIDTHDALGRIVKTEKINAFQETVFLEELFYNANGKLARQKSVVFPGKNCVTSRWRYGLMNRLESLVEADHKVTTYDYTAKGLVHHIYKPNGTILTYRYDPLGRPLELTASDGQCHYQYQYNKLGQLICSTDVLADTSTVRNYDAFGNLTQETLANGLMLKSTYDLQRRRTQLILPDETPIDYGYDALYLRSVSWKDHASRYLSYDLAGHLLEQELIDNLGTLQWAYNGCGFTTSLTTPCGNQRVEAFDGHGNILEMRWDSPSSQRAATYAYDSLSQLVKETGLFAHTYSYDSHNNRLQKSQQTYQVNDLNQLTSHYTYDPNGNPLTKSEFSYTYDSLDRLISATRGNLRITFTYDSFHRRLSKTVAYLKDNEWQESEHILFFYDDQNEIGSMDRKGNIIELRILGQSSQAERGAAIALQLEDTVYVPLHDLQGNVTNLMAMDGSVVQSCTYSAFGEERMTGNCNLINPWRYASKRKDNETSLIYFGRRYYDPEVGRWLTPDPEGFSNGLNLYAYVLNDPLTRIDLYGLEAIQSNQSGWWDRACNHFNTFREHVGRTIQDFFYYCVPVPIVRQVGQALGNLMRPVHGPIGRGTSEIRSVGEGELSPNCQVFSVNGIHCTRDEAREMAQSVSDSIGGKKVLYVYNASHGPVLDFMECAMEKLGFHTHASRLLTRTLREHSEKVGPNGTLAIFAHSEGGIHTDNAIERVNQTVRAKVEAYTFGSGSLFEGKGTAYTRHYVSSRDPIIACSPITFCKSRFSNNSNVEVLQSSGGSPLANHSFMHETYQSRLKIVGRNIVRRFGGGL